jgi:hypothetical protein
MIKKILGPLLLLILVVGVGGAIFFAASQQVGESKIVTLKGVIGSEKEDFFKDPRVVEALRKAHLEVNIVKAGSREIATTFDLREYDFVSPSGVPAKEKLGERYNVAEAYEVFFTPMALASWQPIARILEANGVATNRGDYYTLDLAAFLDLVAKEKRWNELTNSADYNVNKSVLIASTDVRSSNSAAMYLSLASFVLNDNNIVQNDTEIARVFPSVEPLFLRQGFQAGSSAVPFNDYLAMGIGKAPLVMIYESQFIYQATTGGGIKPDMVLIYPEPTLYTKHYIVVPGHSDKAEHAILLGKLLSNDPELQNDPSLGEVAKTLQKLEIEHGFRNSNLVYFTEFTNENNVAVADTLVNIIDPPTYEILEKMIQQIETSYQ